MRCSINTLQPDCFNRVFDCCKTSLFLFFMNIGLFLLITRIDDGRILYCTHEVVTDTLSDPSLYCQLSGKIYNHTEDYPTTDEMLLIFFYFTGAIFHFIVMLMGIFWFLHLSHVYLNILFPIQLNFLNRKTWSRGLHITEVAGAIILSAIGPMTVFISGNKYNITTLPPVVCFPASIYLSIYTMFIPLVLMCTIGVCVIITIFWTLIKVHSYVYSIVEICMYCRVATHCIGLR